MTLRSVWAWLLDADWKTWAGHGVVGFAMTLVAGWQFTLGAFVYREVSDLVSWWADPEPVTPLGSGYGKRPLEEKLKDGFFDLWAPMVGAAIATMVRM